MAMDITTENVNDMDETNAALVAITEVYNHTVAVAVWSTGGV